jgi:hypothetical protein
VAADVYMLYIAVSPRLVLSAFWCNHVLLSFTVRRRKVKLALGVGKEAAVFLKQRGFSVTYREQQS